MDESSQPPLFDESMPGPSPISGTLNGATPMEEEEEEEEAPRRNTASPVEDVDGDQAADQAKQKRHYVLMELVETEKDYVADLGKLVDGYMKLIEEGELPPGMQGKERIVFANIQQIYEFHRDTFQKQLAKCLDDFQEAPRAFVKHERRLHMYVVYCQNKPKSEFIVSEYEQFFNDIKAKLGHKLNVADLLIKPVQRIMKYQLLLKDIMKYTERAQEDTMLLNKALQVMHVVPKACDDMMHVGRLQGFDGKITAQGKLLKQGTLLVSENPPNQPFKPKERRVFMFEQSLIMADLIKPKNEFAQPNYIYRCHILVNFMALDPEVPGEPLRFILKNKNPQNNLALLVQAASAEEKQDWMTELKKLLETQQDFLQALQNPMAYQKEKEKVPDELLTNSKEALARKKSPMFNRLTGHLSKSKSANQEPPAAASAPASLQSPPSDPNLKTGDDSKAGSTSPKSKGGLFNGFKSFKLKKRTKTTS